MEHEPQIQPNFVADTHVPLELYERQDLLVGQIAAEVARDITEGRLLPGADLNSVELASRFNTSRTPIREALMLLEKEGLVEILPRRRPRVAHISLAEIAELYDIRAVLNGFMIRKFIENASGEDLDEMDAILAKLRTEAARRDVPSFLATRTALHNFWVDRCGNSSLQRLLRSWKMRMSVTRLGGDVSREFDRILLDNERLAIACREHDSALGVALITSMTHFGEHMIRQQQTARRETGMMP
ncbi:GntR family transcriptional regulator [Novosphingobium lindaniclasticum]|uniref:HTH gntR-type domain-containing protein n=1 Tax=Novosphingobium lindaniclasticum LE124 TaxID=1096930 RepID=T0HMQ9_9SPHN|nr:GntR family transcriptional regulator [Novosphingobium lindaniclasticum]EQB14287.1 hypothetical protein L284_12900 [Novosphingobium lindaniclasticum LE124]